MTDPKTIRAALGPRPKFTDALAAHLADVRNADEAHRIIRPQHEQKLEALTRMVYEMHGNPALDRLNAASERVNHAASEEIRARVEAGQKVIPTAELDHVRLDALLAALDGTPDPRDVCEGCGDPECPA